MANSYNMKRRINTPLTVSLTVAFIAMSGPCAAQVTSKPVLTLDGAKQAIAAAASRARTKAGTGSIAIVDDGGNLIALELLDNTFPAAANISIGKARTAASQSSGSASSPAPNSGSAPVAYFDKNQVEDSLQRGGVLYPGDGHNYQVLTSRRDKPGQVEVHTLDADVIYVLQGHATFITRGTHLDGKTIGPNEIRGMQLNGLKSPLT